MNIIKGAPAPHEGFSPWIAYDGVDCMLDDKTRVQIKFANEVWEGLSDWYINTLENRVEDWRWEWHDDELDIVAFSFFIDDEEN